MNQLIKHKIVESDAVIRAKLKYKNKDIEKFREDNKTHCRNYYLRLSPEKREISRIKCYERYLRLKDTPEFKEKTKENWIKRKERNLNKLKKNIEIISLSKV